MLRQLPPIYHSKDNEVTEIPIKIYYTERDYFSFLKENTKSFKWNYLIGFVIALFSYELGFWFLIGSIVGHVGWPLLYLYWHKKDIKVVKAACETLGYTYVPQTEQERHDT